jgi:hypothetical protein
MNNKIFIGKDFIASQYLWVIPIIDGFCKKLKIKEIVLEKRIPDNVYSLSIIKKILNDYNLIIVEDNLSLWRKYNLKYLVILFTKFFLIFKFFLRIHKSYLLKKKYSYRSIQISHGIWDYINYNLKEKNLKKNFFLKIISVILSIYKLDLINYIFNKYPNIKYAFLGHSVYQSRIALAELRSLGVKIISQASFNLHFQRNNKDVSWSEITLDFYKKIIKIIKKKNIEIYWKKRISGRGNYEDSRLALFNKKNKYTINSNYIFLHIFKDSPFNIIDRSRIFADYFDWIINTLNIIKKTNQNWSIRIHPSSKRWGEDQILILNKILNDNLSLEERKFFFIDNSYFSNVDVFKNIKKAVTFSGTAHLEIACFGIKPIVISRVSSENINNQLFLKPKTISEYKDLLLTDSNSSIFKLNKAAIKTAKNLIFIRENISRLKKDLNSFELYKNDNQDIRGLEFKKIKNSLKSNIKFLFLNGSYLAAYKTHTISKKYLKLILKNK